MRYLARAVLCVFLATGSHASLAYGQESLFGWWPFKAKEKEPFVQTPSMYEYGDMSNPPGVAVPPLPPHSAATNNTDGVAAGTLAPASRQTTSANQPLPQSPPLSADAAEQSPFFPSPFANFHWPEFPTLPLRPGKAEAEEARNAWIERNPDPARPSPWQAVTSGAHRVRDSTKAAWRKTVDVLTPGEPPTTPPRLAERNHEPSFWSRMFPGETQKAPEGPRTVNEWMGQERLKP